MALNTRRAARQFVPLGMGRGAVLGLVLVALLALAGLLTFQFASRIGSGASQAPVIHPQFSLSPAVASGDGWEIEVRVSNLAALDLVLAVEAENFPGLRVSMLDLNSGQTVAAGTFGPGPFVRLRDNPAQLLVSDRSPTTNAYRLLIFDIEDGGLRLASELPLPLRYGYHGYNNAMRLSTDGRYLFISQRSRLETAECSQLNYDSNVCLRYEVGVLDLDAPTLVNSVVIPGPCGGMAFNAVSNDSIIVRCSFSNSTFEMNAAGVASERLVYDWVAAPGVPGQGDTLGMSYATRLSDGSLRVVRGDGAVLSDPGQILHPGLLPAGHQVVGAERVDDRHVLLETGPRQEGGMVTTELWLVDLEGPEIRTRFVAPVGFVDAYVVNPDSAMLLVHHGPQQEFRPVSLKPGEDMRLIALTGLPGEPEDLTR